MKKIFSFLIVCVFALLLTSCGKGQTSIKIDDPTYIPNPDEIKLDAPNGEYQLFSSKDEIIAYFNNSSSNINLRKNYEMGGGAVYAEDAAANYSPEPTSPTNAEPGTGTAYQTNNQVEGVDEADIVKVHGNVACYLTSDVLYLFKYENSELKPINSIRFAESKTLLQEDDSAAVYHFTRLYPQDLYMSDQYIILHYEKNEYDYCEFKENGNSYHSYANYKYSSGYQLFDINTLEEVKTIKTAGSNVSTRLIDNTLYIINNYSEFNYNYRLPYYGIDEQLYEASVDHIAYCPHIYNAYYFVSIYKIELNSEPIIENIHIASPYIDNLYVNENNTYLINSWSYTNVKEEGINYQYPTSNVLVISNATLKVLGSFVTIGSIQDRYWIDEYNGYIRTVTTGRVYKTKYYFGIFPYTSSNETFNYLTIYQIKEDGIEQVSMITEGIGKPNENIKSARFSGDRLTVVTFVQTDPIYYIDLSNPLKPVITSAYEISGYSVYQLPYLDHYVLGFGYEVEDNVTIGYKITLFDTTDQQMKAVGQSYVYLYKNNARYYPDFIYNPKAILNDLSHNFFGYHEYSYSYSSNYSQYGKFNRYLVFHIDPSSEKPIQPILIEECEYNGNWRDDDLNRMIYINNDYFLLSSEKILNYKRDGAKLIKVGETPLN